MWIHSLSKYEHVVQLLERTLMQSEEVFQSYCASLNDAAEETHSVRAEIKAAFAERLHFEVEILTKSFELQLSSAEQGLLICQIENASLLSRNGRLTERLTDMENSINSLPPMRKGKG